MVNNAQVSAVGVKNDMIKQHTFTLAGNFKGLELTTARQILS